MEKATGIKKHIPNFITSLNILCGSVAVILTLEKPEFMHISAFLIILAAIFDFLDGMSARLLKAYSPMGKELDSLADMVSFGLAPTVIMYQLFKVAVFGNEDVFAQGIDATILLVPMLIAIFSGIRLAKFNVDTRQTESFIGLATPANALIILSFPLILKYHDYGLAHQILSMPMVLTCLTIFLSLMLVAEFPMFSLKFKNLKFADNKLRFIFIITSILSVVFFHFIGITITMFLYITFSAVDNWVISKNKK